MLFLVVNLGIRKIPSVIDNVLVKVRAIIPQEFANELSMECLRVNINREKTLSIVLIVISFTLLYSDFATMSIYLNSVDKVVLSKSRRRYYSISCKIY